MIDQVKTFYVYFDQVNQTRIEVRAKTPEAALKRAAKDWREAYGQPSGGYIGERGIDS